MSIIYRQRGTCNKFFSRRFRKIVRTLIALQACGMMTKEAGMIIKKIALPLSVLCALAFAFFPASCTVKSSEKAAQEAADALAMPFAPIDFDKAEAANEGLQKESETGK